MRAACSWRSKWSVDSLTHPRGKGPHGVTSARAAPPPSPSSDRSPVSPPPERPQDTSVAARKVAAELCLHPFTFFSSPLALLVDGGGGGGLSTAACFGRRGHGLATAFWDSLARQVVAPTVPERDEARARLWHCRGRGATISPRRRPWPVRGGAHLCSRSERGFDGVAAGPRLRSGSACESCDLPARVGIPWSSVVPRLGESLVVCAARSGLVSLVW